MGKKIMPTGSWIELGYFVTCCFLTGTLPLRNAASYRLKANMNT